MNFSPNEDIDDFVNSLKARTLDANFKGIRHEILECLAPLFDFHALADYLARSPPSPCPICQQNHWKEHCPQNRHATSATPQSKAPSQRCIKHSSPLTRYQRLIGRTADVQKYLKVHINGHPARLQLDTGAHVITISRPTWMQLGGPQLQKASDTLRGANGLPLRIYGKFDAAFVVVDNRGKAHP
ncbi:hypothetical protein V3C99_015051 [Haemonchus contortus]|uniref:Peptidase A2 domain-containing protein n=1 Tax=Haemonchus contortus TaxID=6289 RepID=A0A7I4YT95_HAECO